MTNYIRAQFCTLPPLEAGQVYHLLEALARHDCRPDLDFGGGQVEQLQGLAKQVVASDYSVVRLEWHIHGQRFAAELTKLDWSEGQNLRLSLDVDERVFLPKGRIDYVPHSDVRFEAFKQLIIKVVEHIQPLVGVIDYEADLLCGSLHKCKSIPSWGNYFSQALLRHWPREDMNALQGAVDEYIWMDGLGVLTFMHPLAANQAWTPHHELLEGLLQRHPIVGNLE